ncbi:hypothetical protein K488DRAFT_83528 [Vararia minispora EC-137]|uniref:Uncharacterized protein n=1 Tax=Vararia minispora EC-137 TaxID=1314806 RepID=A0ACB8QU87_9AGAM|nr:hypothetical protein K488DRAFT_83528 [Vararia minispora EC-137]
MSFSLGGGQGGADKGTKDGPAYLPCVKCDREVSGYELFIIFLVDDSWKIASNRYAAHLGSCLAVGSPRKAAQRVASAKASSEAGSPFPSENGDATDSPKPTVSAAPKKGRPPKNKGKAAEDPIKKRPVAGGLQSSPQKNKMQKTGAVSSPLARATSEGGTLNGNTSSSASTLTKVPSRLRKSSTAAVFGRDSSASRSPSPALAASLAPPTNGFGKNNGIAGQTRGPSPLGPPPPTPVIHRPSTDYLIGDVEGEETGSSTDTDSD